MVDRNADCWSWQAAQKEKEKDNHAATEDAAPKYGVKNEVPAVDVGSLKVGPRLCERVLDPVG